MIERISILVVQYFLKSQIEKFTISSKNIGQIPHLLKNIHVCSLVLSMLFNISHDFVDTCNIVDVFKLFQGRGIFLFTHSNHEPKNQSLQVNRMSFLFFDCFSDFFSSQLVPNRNFMTQMLLMIASAKGLSCRWHHQRRQLTQIG